jgi:hypothetical protein
MLLALPGRAEDLAAVLQGVAAVAAPGLPGSVCALSEQAFVVVDGPAGGGVRQPVVAAARHGKGRAVLFGHDGYFKPDALRQADTTPLLMNLIRWAAPAAGDGAAAEPRVGVVGLPALAAYLNEKGADAVAVDGAAVVAATDPDAGYRVLLLPPGTPRTQADADALRRYVEGGRAAFFAQTGWGWLQLNPGKSLSDDLPLNRLLAPMGLALADGQIEKRADGVLPVSKTPPATVHARAAVDLLLSSTDVKDPQLLRDRKDDLAQAAATVMYASRAAPAESAVVRTLREVAARRRNVPLPSPARPLRQTTDALARVLLSVQLRDLERTPVDQVTAHPSAALFPGAVPAEAERVTRTVAVDLRVPRWRSTGLYAAPGEVVTVTVPEGAVGKGLFVRIGPHTDRTYHLASWRRAPEISKSFRLTGAVTKVASPFGGLLYVEVPQSRSDESVPVMFANAVPAPLFELGKTTPQQWRESVRSRPAPWAELATSKMVITLKSEAVRALEDPTAVMEHWDRVMDACATLAGRPVERQSPERIVSDADISAGYMHSGYPIMTGLDVTTVFADLPRLRTVDHGWGFYHEVGHNHQSPDWTFAGTTEVTVNLFTMYVLETVCDVPRAEAARRALTEPAERIKRYLAKPDFEAWKADPFLALAMYTQLREAFGWEPYRKVFAEYRGLAPAEKPRTEQEKRDQWMVRMSRAVGKNLGPFFEAWGVPTTEAARRSVETLPGWMPAEMAGAVSPQGQ